MFSMLFFLPPRLVMSDISLVKKVNLVNCVICAFGLLQNVAVVFVKCLSFWPAAL